METSLDVDQVCELLKRNASVTLVDVREPEEVEQARMEGSICIPLQNLTEGTQKLDVPKDQQVIVICRSGRRSSLAAEYLRSQGFQAVNMEGGMRDWIKHRYNEGLLSEDEFIRMSIYLGPHNL